MSEPKILQETALGAPISRVLGENRGFSKHHPVTLPGENACPERL